MSTGADPEARAVEHSHPGDRGPEVAAAMSMSPGVGAQGDEPDLPAGDFSSWITDVQAAIRGERAADVPCRGCTACCRSSQFVHIGPDETDTLSHIPAELLFPAPRLPRGHVLLGYDERGHCPMLVDDQCSIYEHRPVTCRAYDCRVFPATGVAVDDKPLIARPRRAVGGSASPPQPTATATQQSVPPPRSSASNRRRPPTARRLPPTPRNWPCARSRRTTSSFGQTEGMHFEVEHEFEAPWERVVAVLTDSAVPDPARSPRSEPPRGRLRIRRRLQPAVASPLYQYIGQLDPIVRRSSAGDRSPGSRSSASMPRRATGSFVVLGRGRRGPAQRHGDDRSRPASTTAGAHNDGSPATSTCTSRLVGDGRAPHRSRGCTPARRRGRGGRERVRPRGGCRGRRTR